MARRVLPASIVRSALRTRRLRQARAFTLVELAVVVAIVGVLAVLAVVSYRRYILHSKIGEAHAVIGAIRIAQEDHKAERGLYANVGPQWCPASAGNINNKYAWTPTCPGGTGDWQTLPVHIDGPVHFAYSTVAGTDAFAAPTNASWVNWGTPPAGHWYVVMAKCDMDGAGGLNTELVGSGYTNTIFARQEGE